MNKSYTTIIIYLPVFSVWAQSVPDTVPLSSVDIIASPVSFKNKTFDAGKKIQTLDSISKEVFVLNPLSDILNYQTAVFVKNYAPGSISSTSIRGGNAQQTMVLWNGVSINHPMLGQADFSQYPSGLFDDLSIEYGPSSALWGSSAVNATIQLYNTFAHQKKINLRYRRSSFNTHSIAMRINQGVHKFSMYAKPYFIVSQNNYKIGDSMELKNAHYIHKGLISGIEYAIHTHHRLQWHIWYNHYNRQLPNNYFFNNHAAHQMDKNIRSVLAYNFFDKKWKSSMRLAYLYDQLNYNDSLARINSYSHVHTWQNEENVWYDMRHNLQIFAGHQWVQHFAITNNYLSNKILSRHALFAGLQHQTNSLKYTFIVRKEWANIQSAIPITGNIGASYQIHPFVSLKTQSSLFYRLPTLNDLYWRGSGNPSLKPESGYHYEIGTVLRIPVQKWCSDIHSEITAFFKYTNNWIIWLPGNHAQPVPANIAAVWSRGTETDNYWLYQHVKTKIKLGVHTAYILSTIEKSTIANDASLGRQLIYTPRYNINGYGQVQIHHSFAMLTYQYVGYRFTTSDNLQWLEPYYIMNISVGQKFSFKYLAIQCITSIHNLLNTSYMIVTQRPMPGRSYSIQINIEL